MATCPDRTSDLGPPDTRVARPGPGRWARTAPWVRGWLAREPVVSSYAPRGGFPMARPAPDGTDAPAVDLPASPLESPWRAPPAATVPAASALAPSPVAPGALPAWAPHPASTVATPTSATPARARLIAPMSQPPSSRPSRLGVAAAARHRPN